MNTEPNIAKDGKMAYAYNALLHTLSGAACGSLMGVIYITIASSTTQVAFIGVAIVLAITGSGLGLLRAIADNSR